MEKINSKIKKVMAVLVSISFVFTETVAAAPAITTASVLLERDGLRIQHLAEALEISSEYGVISERYIDTSSKSPVVVHIQDAHGQYEAQKNTQAILSSLLSDFNINTIFQEGVLGYLDPTLVEYFAEKELNDQLVHELGKEGVLGGSELFLYENSNKQNVERARVLGVEDLELYKRNLEAYRIVYSKKELSDKTLEKMKNKILTRASKVMNKELGNFFREWMFYRDTSRELMRHLTSLEKYTKQVLDIDLNEARQQMDWPQLVRYFKLQSLQADLGDAASKKEFSDFVNWIKEQDLEKDYAGIFTKWFEEKQQIGSSLQLRKLLEEFHDDVAAKNFSFNAYPELSKVFAMDILSSEIMAEDMMAEVKEITSRILSGLAKTDEERKIIELYEDYMSVKNLFALELVHDDYEKLKANQDKVKITLQKMVKNSEVTQLFDQAMAFYTYAIAREKAIFERMMAQMKKTNENHAVLITGGFHSKGLHDYFKENHISYVEVMPRMTHIEENTSYSDIMTLKKSPLAKNAHMDQMSPMDVFLAGMLPEYSKHLTTNFIQVFARRVLRNNPAVSVTGELSTDGRSEQRFNDHADARARREMFMKMVTDAEEKLGETGKDESDKSAVDGEERPKVRSESRTTNDDGQLGKIWNIFSGGLFSGIAEIIFGKKKEAKRSSRRALHTESLEDRRLLATDLGVSPIEDRLALVSETAVTSPAIVSNVAEQIVVSEDLLNVLTAQAEGEGEVSLPAGAQLAASNSSNFAFLVTVDTTSLAASQGPRNVLHLINIPKYKENPNDPEAVRAITSLGRGSGGSLLSFTPNNDVSPDGKTLIYGVIAPAAQTGGSTHVVNVNNFAQNLYIPGRFSSVTFEGQNAIVQVEGLSLGLTDVITVDRTTLAKTAGHSIISNPAFVRVDEETPFATAEYRTQTGGHGLHVYGITPNTDPLELQQADGFIVTYDSSATFTYVDAVTITDRQLVVASLDADHSNLSIIRDPNTKEEIKFNGIIDEVSYSANVGTFEVTLENGNTGQVTADLTNLAILSEVENRALTVADANLFTVNDGSLRRNGGDISLVNIISTGSGESTRAVPGGIQVDLRTIGGVVFNEPISQEKLMEKGTIVIPVELIDGQITAGRTQTFQVELKGSNHKTYLYTIDNFSSLKPGEFAYVEVTADTIINAGLDNIKYVGAKPSFSTAPATVKLHFRPEGVEIRPANQPVTEITDLIAGGDFRISTNGTLTPIQTERGVWASFEQTGFVSYVSVGVLFSHDDALPVVPASLPEVITVGAFYEFDRGGSDVAQLEFAFINGDRVIVDVTELNMSETGVQVSTSYLLNHGERNLADLASIELVGTPFSSGIMGIMAAPFEGLMPAQGLTVNDLNAISSTTVFGDPFKASKPIGSGIYLVNVASTAQPVKSAGDTLLLLMNRTEATGYDRAYAAAGYGVHDATGFSDLGNNLNFALLLKQGQPGDVRVEIADSDGGERYIETLYVSNQVGETSFFQIDTATLENTGLIDFKELVITSEKNIGMAPEVTLSLITRPEYEVLGPNADLTGLDVTSFGLQDKAIDHPGSQTQIDLAAGIVEIQGNQTTYLAGGASDLHLTYDEALQAYVLQAALVGADTATIEVHDFPSLDEVASYVLTGLTPDFQTYVLPTHTLTNIFGMDANTPKNVVLAANIPGGDAIESSATLRLEPQAETLVPIAGFTMDMANVVTTESNYSEDVFLASVNGTITKTPASFTFEAQTQRDGIRNYDAGGLVFEKNPLSVDGDGNLIFGVEVLEGWEDLVAANATVSIEIKDIAGARYLANLDLTSESLVGFSAPLAKIRNAGVDEGLSFQLHVEREGSESLEATFRTVVSPVAHEYLNASTVTTIADVSGFLPNNDFNIISLGSAGDSLARQFNEAGVVQIVGSTDGSGAVGFFGGGIRFTSKPAFDPESDVVTLWMRTNISGTIELEFQDDNNSDGIPDDALKAYLQNLPLSQVVTIDMPIAALEAHGVSVNNLITVIAIAPDTDSPMSGYIELGFKPLPVQPIVSAQGQNFKVEAVNGVIHVSKPAGAAHEIVSRSVEDVFYNRGRYPVDTRVDQVRYLNTRDQMEYYEIQLKNGDTRILTINEADSGLEIVRKRTSVEPVLTEDGKFLIANSRYDSSRGDVFFDTYVYRASDGLLIANVPQRHYEADDPASDADIFFGSNFVFTGQMGENPATLKTEVTGVPVTVEILYLRNPVDALSQPLFALEAKVGVGSPDGKHIAVADRRSGNSLEEFITLTNLETGSSKEITENPSVLGFRPLTADMYPFANDQYAVFGVSQYINKIVVIPFDTTSDEIFMSMPTDGVEASTYELTPVIGEFTSPTVINLALRNGQGAQADITSQVVTIKSANLLVASELPPNAIQFEDSDVYYAIVPLHRTYSNPVYSLQIFKMNSDGTTLNRIHIHYGDRFSAPEEGFVVLSPDETKVAFVYGNNYLRNGLDIVKAVDLRMIAAEAYSEKVFRQPIQGILSTPTQFVYQRWDGNSGSEKITRVDWNTLEVSNEIPSVDVYLRSWSTTGTIQIIDPRTREIINVINYPYPNDIGRYGALHVIGDSLVVDFNENPRADVFTFITQTSSDPLLPVASIDATAVNGGMLDPETGLLSVRTNLDQLNYAVTTIAPLTGAVVDTQIEAFPVIAATTSTDLSQITGDLGLSRGATHSNWTADGPIIRVRVSSDQNWLQPPYVSTSSDIVASILTSKDEGFVVPGVSYSDEKYINITSLPSVTFAASTTNLDGRIRFEVIDGDQDKFSFIVTGLVADEERLFTISTEDLKGPGIDLDRIYGFAVINPDGTVADNIFVASPVTNEVVSAENVDFNLRIINDRVIIQSKDASRGETAIINFPARENDGQITGGQALSARFLNQSSDHYTIVEVSTVGGLKQYVIIDPEADGNNVIRARSSREGGLMTPDGSKLITLAESGYNARVYDIQSGQKLTDYSGSYSESLPDNKSKPLSQRVVLNNDFAVVSVTRSWRPGNELSILDLNKNNERKLTITPAAGETVDATQLRIMQINVDDSNIVVLRTEGQDGKSRRLDINLNEAIMVEKDPKDTNGDGTVSPLDALLIINFLNNQAMQGSYDIRLDVNADGHVVPLDILQIINYLNQPTAIALEPVPVSKLVRATTRDEFDNATETSDSAVRYIKRTTGFNSVTYSDLSFIVEDAGMHTAYDVATVNELIHVASKQTTPGDEIKVFGVGFVAFIGRVGQGDDAHVFTRVQHLETGRTLDIPSFVNLDTIETRNDVTQFIGLVQNSIEVQSLLAAEGEAEDLLSTLAADVADRRVSTDEDLVDPFFAENDLLKDLFYRSEQRLSPQTLNYLRQYGVSVAAILAIAQIAHMNIVAREHRQQMALYTALVNAVAPHLAKAAGVDQDEVNVAIRENIESIQLMLDAGLLQFEGVGTAITSTEGLQPAFFLAVIPYLAALANLEAQKGTPLMILGGPNTQAIKKAVYSAKNTLSPKERAMTGRLLKFLADHESIPSVVKRELAKEIPDRGLAASVTDEEASKMEAVLSRLLSLIHDPIEDVMSVEGLSAKEVAAHAEAYVVRIMMAVEIAYKIATNADTLREGDRHELRLVLAYFEEKGIRVDLNPNGTIRVSLQSITKYLSNLRAALQAQAKSA